MPDFLPRRDVDLLQWSASFSHQLNLAPGDYGLSPDQAARYADAHALFATAYAAVSNPSERTRSTIAHKDTVRASMKALARVLAAVVRASPQVTDAQLIALGLKPKRRPGRSIGRPDSAPLLRILSVIGPTLRVRLSDVASPTHLRKPRGVRAAALFYFVGDAPPSDLTEWTFANHASRVWADVTIPGHIPAGSQVWLTAQWQNPRGAAGPTAAPVRAWLQFGLTSMPRAA